MSLTVFFARPVISCIVLSQAAVTPNTQDLRRLSLQELMQVEVTVVTRQPEPLGTAAAAVSVITREDIRRSGVTTIADALALAGGVQVARFNNGSWAVSARGFNGSTPNKLLVMVDFRNEFTPLFTGVFWNLVDYVLDDVERIEVIRGPGASLWGANAVNGVVNIITRHTRDTRGTLVTAGSGPEDPAVLELRHGGGSDRTGYRVYGKFGQRDAQRFSTGGSSGDTRRRGQAGIRFDADRGTNTWLLKADVFHSRDDFIDRRDGEWTEITLQGRLSLQFSNKSRLQLQSYYRREYRNVERQLTHHLDTVDIDAQHSLRVGGRHGFIWGGGYRVNHDQTYGSAVIHFDPPARTYPLLSAFAQDELTVFPDRVFVTAGLKVEHNAFSGTDWQPNLRARWLLPRQQVLWSAVARAVRRPTRLDDDIVVTAPSGPVLIQGSNDFESEAMTGWELGYRASPASRLSFEAITFLQRYGNLRSQEAPFTGQVPLTIANTLDGRSRGMELAVNTVPLDRWRIRASYSLQDTDIKKNPGSRDVTGGVSEANDPRHLATLRTGVDLAANIQMDGWLRHVSSLPNPAVPAYTELNARIGWRPTRALELALVGQDLLHDQHPESGNPLPRRIEFQRSLRAVLTLRIP